MSRAFVKEDDEAVEARPERPVSTAPNLVTARGIDLIDAEIARLAAELQSSGEDRDARARVQRDLRYWNARRGSAQVMPAPPDRDSVHFGSSVVIEREDGRRQTFRIVGEDEADPEAGAVSHVSPLARALMGRRAGDVVEVAGWEAEIIEIG